MQRITYPVVNGCKYCNGCKTEKPVSEFSIFNGKPQSWCKGCMNNYRKRHHTYYRVCYVEKQTCDIIKDHHEEMKDDPNHLTTEFMQKMIGRKC
jgi:hypothetical protein